MATSGPALAANDPTEISTASVLLHPPTVTVTVYVVVTVGDATGFAIVALLNPVAGDHE